MRWLMVVPMVAACLLLGNANSARAQAPRAESDEYSFYGLRFGMSLEEVRKLVPTNGAGTEAIEVKHGMRYLQFTFDYRNRLSEIRASWERPADALREAALRLALKERFVQPISTQGRGVSANLDEGFNRAAITLVMISQTMRQEAIEHFRDEYLRAME